MDQLTNTNTNTNNWNLSFKREKQEKVIIDFLDFHRNKGKGETSTSNDDIKIRLKGNRSKRKPNKKAKGKTKAGTSNPSDLDVDVDVDVNGSNTEGNPLLEDIKYVSDSMGLFITGPAGSGKTGFIHNLMRKPEVASNFDFIYFNAADQRNKNVISEMTSQNMTSQNVHQMFFSKRKQLVFIMDDINHMNQTDKFGLNILIKMLRTKKTRKQKGEITTNIPVICIGNKGSDKKLKDLAKGCVNVYLLPPCKEEIGEIISNTFPSMSNGNGEEVKEILLNAIGGDLRKLAKYLDLLKHYNHDGDDNNNDDQTDFSNFLELLQQNRGDVVKENLILNTIDDSMTKLQVKNLFSNYYPIIQHRNHILEADRTTISMIWHENVIDLNHLHLHLNQGSEFNSNIKQYVNYLKNLTFADVLDRVTFLKQIWHCSEISSLIKTYYNNYLLHHSGYMDNHDNDNDNDNDNNNNNNSLQSKELRFTKILTRYSTEFNNTSFKNTLTQRLIMDRKDLNTLFYHGLCKKVLDIQELLELNDITELEQKRYLKMLYAVLGDSGTQSVALVDGSSSD